MIYSITEDYNYIVVDGNLDNSKDKILKKISDRLKFPDYFGNNWDALFDCLTDLSWLEDQESIILLKNIGDNIPNNDATKLRNILKDSQEFWKRKDIEFVIIDIPDCYRINKLEFEIKSLSKDRGGLEWEGLLGGINIIINGETTITNDTFELTSTIKEFHDGLTDLFSNGSTIRDFFCCGCGDHGCFYVNWACILDENNVIIKMENLISEPIGKYLYIIDKSIFIKSILTLFDLAISYMEKNNIEELFHGSMKDFKQMRNEISLIDN